MIFDLLNVVSFSILRLILQEWFKEVYLYSLNFLFSAF